MRRSLPHDVMLDILARLPVRSLVRFRCVCNLWNAMFHDSHFVSKQVSYASKRPATFVCCSYEDEVGFYSFEIEAGGEVVPSNKLTVPVRSQGYYRMSNTCNGLMAFWGGGYTYVANLSTREWVALPLASPLVSKNRIENLDSIVGFGFCMATSKYKVVRFINPGAEDRWIGEVVTVGTDRSWRSLGEMPYPIPEFVPVYTNGYILWIIGTGWVNGYFCVGHNLILSFDVRREEFTTIELPPCHPEPYGAHREFFMSIWETSVCLVDWRVHLDEEGCCYLPVMHFHVLESSIWMLKCSVKLSRVERCPVKYRNPKCVQMSPVIIRDGKLLIYCPYDTWRLQDLHTQACSMIQLPSLLDLGNRSIPFACALTIAPINRLPRD